MTPIGCEGLIKAPTLLSRFDEGQEYHSYSFLPNIYFFSPPLFTKSERAKMKMLDTFFFHKPPLGVYIHLL
jgi:hypothetical protein